MNLFETGIRNRGSRHRPAFAVGSFITTNAGVIKKLEQLEPKEAWGHTLRYSNYLCFCGKEFQEFDTRIAKSKHSCGCYQRKHRKSGNNSRTHGMSKTPEYKTWHEMRRRCVDPTRQNYYLYGGRGIKVCARWMNSFEDFYADMGKRPHGYSIERMDHNGDYEPLNCKWIPLFDQGSNKRNNHWVDLPDKKRTLAQICRDFNLKDYQVEGFVKRGTLMSQLKKRGYYV